MEVLDAGEGAAADRLPGDDPEEDLDHVQPRSRGRGEVHRDSRVACEPGLHRRVFMGGVVVHDQVQLHPRVGLRDLLEEFEELIAAVPRITGIGDLAGWRSPTRRTTSWVPWRT